VALIVITLVRVVCGRHVSHVVCGRHMCHMLVATRSRRRGPALGSGNGCLGCRGAWSSIQFLHSACSGARHSIYSSWRMNAGMLQMMSGAGGPRSGAAGNTTVGECESVQQCCYGGRASCDGQWLQFNIPAAYPHVRFLDSCLTKQGAGAKVGRDYKDWRTIPVVGGESYVVNSSPRHCKICQKKVEGAVNAVHEAQM